MDTSSIAKEIMLWIKGFLQELGLSETLLDKVEPVIYVFIIVIAAFLVAEIIYRIAQFTLWRIQKMREYTFLIKLNEHNVLRKQTSILPPLIMTTLLPMVFGAGTTKLHYMQMFVWIYFIIMLTRAINSLITAIGETAFRNRKLQNRPIKGFVQVAKIIVYIIMTILVISVITDKSPLYLIGGLGAFAAVLMLVTKDSIMGFVGGFLLLENDMVRIGDWIQMQGSAINGIVTDISLTIVKVQNFDNTIATIPPYTLINESFINWRGMNTSGARRIARGYTIKLDNIKPCSDEYLSRIREIDSKMAEYINIKVRQKNAGNMTNTNNSECATNGTIETNAGVFRAYAEMYLQHHPRIRKDLLIMVRTLEPTGNGLPIQFYCFTDTTDWKEYESIQSEIMEHFATIMPLFDLFPYQSTSARDTIISGMLEASFPIEKIVGMPYKSTKQS